MVGSNDISFWNGPFSDMLIFGEIHLSALHHLVHCQGRYATSANHTNLQLPSWKQEKFPIFHGSTKYI